MQKILWFVACALAGLTQAVALSVPWGDSAGQAARLVTEGSGGTLGWLQVLGMAAFFAALRWRLARDGALADPKRRARFAALSALVFALAWLGAALWWLWVSLHVYGGMSAALAAAAVGALVAFLALYYALAGWAWGRWWAQGATPALAAWGALAWAALWTLAEMARGAWFTGFPWGAVGYAHVDGCLAQWAAWVGVYGVGFLAVALAALLGELAASGFHKRFNGAAGLSLVIIFILTGGVHYWKMEIDEDREIPVTLLQANIPQDEKFVKERGIAFALSWYQKQFKNADAGMIVAPETAVPLLPQQLPQGYWRELGDVILDKPARAAIVGAPLGSFARGYTNSAIGIVPWQPSASQGVEKTSENSPNAFYGRLVQKPFSAEVAPLEKPPIISRDITPEIFEAAARFEIPAEFYQYHKHHLVPFGEFIPPLFAWFMELLHMPLGDFSRGPVDAPPLVWNNARWAVHICYEDLFGEELVQRFRTPQNRPDVLVNISNLAWFGDNAVSFQHLHISRMRALEFARPVLRATNTGATAAIDARGQVRAMLAPFKRGVLRARVSLGERSAALTPYARWLLAAGGLWPLVAVALAVLVGARVHCAAFGRAKKPAKFSE